MARILTVTAGLPSVVYPGIELARRLAAAGHRVTCASLAEFRGLVEHHGLDFLPLPAGEYARFLQADRRRGRIARLADLGRRRRRACASLEVDAFAGRVREAAPDLVLVNGEMHEHVIAASGAGARVALMNTFVSIWRSPGLPPPHHLARPGAGWKGSRAGAALLWAALRLRKRVRAVSRAAGDVGCDRLSLLRHMAAEAGFDLRRETDAGQWLIPFTYRRLPILCLHAREFEFPQALPAHVHYVGPMVLESRIDRPLPADAHAALEAVLERRRLAPGGRRLIYAAFGSAFSTDRAFLDRLVSAVAARPDWDLVLSSSGRPTPSELARLPGNVHAFAWVPQLRLLAHADVTVTHGGINTVDECVLHGVPMVVYCGFETDMGGTTGRVVHHGIGIAGDARRDDPGAIRGHVERLLREEGFRTNIERLRARYSAYAGNRVAERTVEALLARGAGERPGPAARAGT